MPKLAKHFIAWQSQIWIFYNAMLRCRWIVIITLALMQYLLFRCTYKSSRGSLARTSIWPLNWLFSKFLDMIWNKWQSVRLRKNVSTNYYNVQNSFSLQCLEVYEGAKTLGKVSREAVEREIPVKTIEFSHAAIFNKTKTKTGIEIYTLSEVS
jgi:hypothetical protein